MTTQQLNEEMLSPEEIFAKYEYLAETTVQKKFANPRKFAESIHLGYEDLIQFALIGLWEGSNTYHSSNHKSNLRSYLIRNIRWSIGRHVDRLTVIDRLHKSQKYTEENQVSLISMSMSPQFDEENANTFYDLIATDNINNFDSTETYPENIVLANLKKEGMLSVLTDSERELVRLRMGNDQLTFKEIGEIYGVSKQNIHMKFKKIQSKCKAYLDKEAVAI